ICDLFTNGSVVQPIGDFITKILVSSANLRFVHERKRCSANWRFHHEDPSFISQFAFVHERKRCSANWGFHHEDSSFISPFSIWSRTQAVFSQIADSSR